MNDAGAAELPLRDLLVIEIGTSVAAPFGGSILAELGAEVIKIENPAHGDDARLWGPPFVDGSSALFHALNRNKRSAAIDFKDDAQLLKLKKFVHDQADIVLQNMRPGIVERYGLDAKSLRTEKPSLIYCDMAAYGTKGPLNSKPGYDPLMQAFAGIMSVTGTEGQDPVRVGPSIVDKGTAMWSVIGILTALYRRQQTGEGTEISTSLFETALAWMADHAANNSGADQPPRRMGTENAGITPYKAYQANDGWLVIAAGNDAMFRRLADILGHSNWAEQPEFASNAARVENRDLLNDMVAGAISTASISSWVEKLDAADVPCAPLQSLDAVLAHPQTKAVGIVQSAPGAPVSLFGLPIRFDGERPPLRSGAPVLGQNSDLILGELGSK